LTTPEYVAQWRKDNPDKVRASHDKYKKRYHRRKHWIDKIKKSQGCAHCGYNEHACALDFDHIDPSEKKFLIPRVLSRKPLKKLFPEIRKCRILCANCHRIHSNKQWHAGVTTPK
jgi:hypothetical protein